MAYESEIGAGSGGLAGGSLGGIVGGIAGGIGGSAIGKSFGAGKTGPNPNAPANVPYSGDPTADAYIKRLNDSPGYNWIAEAANIMKDLKGQLNAGKLSQTNYLNITSKFLPQVTQSGNQLAGMSGPMFNALSPFTSQLNENMKDYQIYQAGQQYLGRDLTPGEVAQIRPRYADNPDTGNAYVAELAKAEEKSPANLAKKAGGFSGQINDTFQQLLSRGASKEEADYFGRMLASGEVTPYEVNAFVQQLPEYQNIQDKAFRGGLEGELAAYDTKAFGRERENILSQYTRAGLQNSSALDYAMTDALGKIQDQRGQFLAGLSSQQYGGNKAAARSDYEAQRNRSFGQQDYGQQRSDAYLDYLTSRADQGADYNRQKNDYLQFLSSQPRQRQGSPWGQLAGGLLGAGIGSFGGAAGAGAGYQIGSGLGSGFDYLR
jgi:hypothetical protein